MESCPINGFSSVALRSKSLSWVKFPKFKVPQLDWWIWNHLVLSGSFYNIPKKLTLYRVHATNLSRSTDFMKGLFYAKKVNFLCKKSLIKHTYQNKQIPSVSLHELDKSTLHLMGKWYFYNLIKMGYQEKIGRYWHYVLAMLAAYCILIKDPSYLYRFVIAAKNRLFHK